MGDRIVRLKSSRLRAPPRRPYLNGRTFLVALFPDDAMLVAFAKHLYREYNISTVDDWDSYSPRLLETYPMDMKSKRRFLKLIGAPNKPERTSAKVLSFGAARLTCG